MKEIYLADGFNITWAIVCPEAKRVQNIFSVCSSRLPLNLRYKLHLDKILKEHNLHEIGCVPGIMGIGFKENPRSNQSWTECLIDITYGNLDWDALREKVEPLRARYYEHDGEGMPDFGKLPR